MKKPRIAGLFHWYGWLGNFRGRVPDFSRHAAGGASSADGATRASGVGRAQAL